MFKSKYIEKMLNVFNVSMFINVFQSLSIILNFSNISMLKFNICGQKGRLNFHFRSNITGKGV